jgi:hypothetical protein
VKAAIESESLLPEMINDLNYLSNVEFQLKGLRLYSGSQAHGGHFKFSTSFWMGLLKITVPHEPANCCKLDIHIKTILVP